MSVEIPVWRRAARHFELELGIDERDARATLAWLHDPAEPYFDLDRKVLAEARFPPPPAA